MQPRRLKPYVARAESPALGWNRSTRHTGRHEHSSEPKPLCLKGISHSWKGLLSQKSWGRAHKVAAAAAVPVAACAGAACCACASAWLVRFVSHTCRSACAVWRCWVYVVCALNALFSLHVYSVYVGSSRLSLAPSCSPVWVGWRFRRGGGAGRGSSLIQHHGASR